MSAAIFASVAVLKDQPLRCAVLYAAACNIKIVPLLLRLFPRGFILAAVGGFQLRKRR